MRTVYYQSVTRKLMSDSGPNPTLELIAALWQRNRPQVLARLALLDRAAAAARTQALTPAMQDEASQIAHMLSGSLGMFGFHEGTELARKLENLLDTPCPKAEPLAALTTQLRQA